MFAPPTAKAETQAPASANKKQSPAPSKPLLRPFARGAAEQLSLDERGIGNQSMLRLMAQQATEFSRSHPDDRNEERAAPAIPTEGRAAGGISWGFGGVPIFPPDRSNEPQAPGSACASSRYVPMILQPKLLVGAVDDPLEQEADRIAGQVVRSPASTAAAPPKISVTPSGPALRGPPLVNTADEPHRGAETPEQVSEVLASPGHPLDGESREAFGSQFGRDFSAVRLHTGAAAATSARALNASAYTVGNSIVFGEGRLNPRSPEGRRLLAHELVHVWQQASLPRLVFHGDGLTQQRLTGSPIQSQETPSGSTGAVAPACLIQRAPPQLPPAPASDSLILGSTDPAAETESLFHYGDLTGRETLESFQRYPRLTDYNLGTTAEDVAKYTGSPVRPALKFKYELKIEKGYFARNFKNTGTRNGYSEFGTDQPIPVKFFRKIATLLRGPSGGVPPSSAGGGGLAGGSATGGGVANAPQIPPKAGQLPGSASEAGAVERGLAKSVPAAVPGGGARGAVEGAVEGATARAVVQGGLRFLGGVAVGAAIGIIVGLLYSYLTRKEIEGDITDVLQNVPSDIGKRIQARIDALPPGKKKLARITLEYTIWRSTLGLLGPPDSYQIQSVKLINVHPGNEELDFPSSTEETLGETIPILSAQKVAVRISYTVPIDAS
jgi:hypothetical protein